MWDRICEAISRQRGTLFRLARKSAVSGGCINRAYRLQGEDGSSYFLKTNASALAEMFAAEAEALEAMQAAQAIRVPTPVAHGAYDAQAYLVLEYIEFGGPRDDAAMGRQLARLHRATGEHFGWTRDNTIGSTPQPNPREADWITFYREHRLGFQFDLCARNGFRFEGSETLRENLDTFFVGYTPAPSLLHGDLWGGNADFARNGDPVIFDPATYYGDREADLAMTELFGGFGPAFYEAYDAEWPRNAGHRRRVPLYNLYHILNHANLFGGGYAAQAQSMIDALVREL